MAENGICYKGKYCNEAQNEDEKRPKIKMI